MNRIIEITSRNNPKIKAFCERAKHPSERDFLLEGKLFVKDICPAWISDLLITGGGENDAVAAAVAEAGGSVFRVSLPVMEKICGTESVQQIAAFVRKPEIPKPNRLVLLDRLQDPGNAGTIIRSAVAFGFGVVFGNGSADPYSQKTVRSSAGTVCRCYIEKADLADAAVSLKAAGYSLFSAELNPSSERLPSVSFQPPFAFVIGNESRGVSPEISALCGQKILIPISDGAESLNAAVAASIMMYTGRGE